MARDLDGVCEDHGKPSERAQKAGHKGLKEKNDYIGEFIWSLAMTIDELDERISKLETRDSLTQDKEGK